MLIPINFLKFRTQKSEAFGKFLRFKAIIQRDNLFFNKCLKWYLVVVYHTQMSHQSRSFSNYLLYFYLKINMNVQH